jgi:hypothetical protein
MKELIAGLFTSTSPHANRSPWSVHYFTADGFESSATEKDEFLQGIPQWAQLSS